MRDQTPLTVQLEPFHRTRAGYVPATLVARSGECHVPETDVTPLFLDAAAGAGEAPGTTQGAN